MMSVRYAPYELSDEGVRWRLHRNEAALPAPEHVVRAIRSLDGQQVRRYPAQAQRELGERLARRLNVSVDRVVLANGADEILCALARGFAAPGDRVLFADPAFGMYERAAELARANPVKVPYALQWTLNAEEVVRCACERTRLVFLGNPNNPTGESISAEFVTAIARALPQAIVAIDEVYLALSERSLLPALEGLQNVVTIGSLSKSAGLAGLRVGYAVARAGVAASLRSQVTPFPLSAPAIAGALAFLSEAASSQAYEIALRAQAARSLDAIECAFRPFATKAWRGTANFVLFEIARAERIVRGLAERGIAIRRFEHPALRSCVRVSAADDDTTDVLVRALPSVMREVRDA